MNKQIVRLIDRKRKSLLSNINGQLYDWEDITCLMPHGEVIGITDISYANDNGVPVTDTLPLVKITKVSTSNSQGF